jgi:hypothetical protein
MTDNQQQYGGESENKTKFKRGILEQIAIWILLFRNREITRERRREKGLKPPTTGITGPVNHGEDGHPWVWMEAETVKGYSLMDVGDKERFWIYLEDALKSFVGWSGSRHDVEFDLQVQALPFDLEKVDADLRASTMGELSGKLRQRHYNSRRRSINEIKRYGLKQRRVFLGVKLRDERSFFHRMLAQLMLLLGFSSLLANGNEDVIYEEQIQEVLDKFRHNHISVELLSGKETAEVIQRCVYRGHDKLPELSNDSGVVKEYADLQAISASVARDHHDMVEILQDGESSFAAYMPVAKLPDDYEGLSWLFYGDYYRQPVEVSARLRIKPLEMSKAENARTLNRLDAALEDLAKKVKSNVEREEARLISRKRVALAEKARLDRDDPKVDTNAVMIVSGKDPSDVRQNSRFVMAQCAHNSVTVLIDDSKMAEIRRQTYPGTRLLYTRYTLNLFYDGLAQAMPHATSVIGNGGDMLGVVLGPEAGPFLYAHRLVLRKRIDSPPGQIFVGPSGEGKSSMMVNCVIADAEAGMAGIYDEGKGDSTILEAEDRLQVDIKVLDLSAPEMAGLLNPLYLGDNLKESRDLTLDVLMKCIGGEADRGWRSLVRRIVAEELEEYPDDPDFERIVHKRLLGASRDDPRYQIKLEIGEAILGMMEAEFAEVIFAKGKPWKDVSDKYIARGQVTFVVYGHLTPPDDRDKPDDDLNEQERLAVMVRQLTNVIYYKFALDPTKPLAMYKDEIHIDKRMGGNVSSGYLARIGRSKGCIVSLGGQLMDDPPEDFWKNTSTVWLFTFRQLDEAEKAIMRLGWNVEHGSQEWKRLINLMMGKRGSGRNKYDVIVMTYDKEIGMVATNQLYHEGLFVTNIEAVEERRRQMREGRAAQQLSYVRRAETPEAAEDSLIILGVPPEVIGSPNGYQHVVDQWKAIAQELAGDERLIRDDDGQLKVVRVTELPVPQLPLPSATEENPEQPDL